MNKKLNALKKTTLWHVVTANVGQGYFNFFNKATLLGKDSYPSQVKYSLHLFSYQTIPSFSCNLIYDTPLPTLCSSATKWQF